MTPSLADLRALLEKATSGPTYRDGTGILRQPSRDAFNDAALATFGLLLDVAEAAQALSEGASTADDDTSGAHYEVVSGPDLIALRAALAAITPPPAPEREK